MKRILSIAFLGLLCLNVFAENKPKNNVVLILIDDLSHYGVSAYGSKISGSLLGDYTNQAMTTPRIDKLAETGVMCNNAFAYPLCENSRISLMSGKYNSRNFLHCKAQHESDVTFGDVFRKAGYATGIFGKWKQTRGTKEVAGKDYIYQFGWDEFCCFDVITEGQRYINPNLVINGKVENYTGRTDLDPETGRRWYGPDICNRKALQFIEKNQDKPFFLYYPMLLVHDEHKPTPDTKPNSLFDNFDEASNNKDGHSGDDKKYFPDMVSYMDKLIGKVVDKLDELGLRENTLIVVMGDNGTKECFTHNFDDGKIYPGRKGGNMDNGIHVPLVLNKPGDIPSGENKIRRYDGLVDIADIFPTICEYAGLKIPNPENLDGISFWQQAKGASGEPREVIYHWFNGNNPITNQSDLLVYAFDKNFKRYAPCTEYPEGRFFDLRTDSLERGGDRVFMRQFKVELFSGLDLKTLSPEQKQAYDRLGKVIEHYTYMPVSSLKIESAGNQLAVGKSMQLFCSVEPRQATRNNIIWESSDPKVATINKFGKVTGLNRGVVTISAFSWDDAYPLSNNESISYSKTGIKSNFEIFVK